ncbi:MAG: hypothetical protein KDA57_16730 [Planctomycetales bacterium]|nr:hypothetical protein [Planctomycetales bacterium]
MRILSEYILLGFLCSCATANTLAGELLQLDNGEVQVGIDRKKGGAITWLSSAAYPHNIINLADPGRLIQQSYYAGKSLDRTAAGQSKAWSPWPWNPIQGGGVGSWARASEFQLQDGTLFSETIPKLWDMPDEEASALMRQWTTFEPGSSNTVAVQCEFVSLRHANDPWGETRLSAQEVPACYFTRNFARFQSYLGHGKWRNESQSVGPPWGKTTPPLKAMACFEANGQQGVAVFSPTSAGLWNFGPHGRELSSKSASGPCVHIAPISRVRLASKSTYRYRYWLIVGDATDIATSLDTLWDKYSHERAELSQP